MGTKARSCRVIVSCFRYGRSARNNSPPTPESGVRFLQRIIKAELDIKTEEKYDLIIVNHDTGYIPGNQYIEALNGESLGENKGTIRTITVPNRGISFCGYSTAFKTFQTDYEYWIFSEDDHILYQDNYYDHFIKEYEEYKDDNIGFLAFAPIATHDQYTPKHSGGGFGLCRREDLTKILNLPGNYTKNYGNDLSCLATRFKISAAEVFFTHDFIRIGKQILPQLTYSCYPVNHHKCADHTIHRNLRKLEDNENYFFQVGIRDGEEW